jgi:serine/threonine protein kinase
MSMSTLKKTEKSIWAEVVKTYKILYLIGEGGYGTVKKAKNIASGNLVAIKHMTNFSHNKYHTLKVLREILIMKSL